MDMNGMNEEPRRGRSRRKGGAAGAAGSSAGSASLGSAGSASHGSGAAGAPYTGGAAGAPHSGGTEGAPRRGGTKAWKKKKLGQSAAFIRFRRIFVLAVLEVFVLGGIFAYSYVLRQYNKIQRPTFEVKNVENTSLSSEDIQKMKGYWNIAAFGVDSRDSSVGRGNNSDVIMVVSINRENGEIRIASVFRDSYLSLSNGMFTKINAAYAVGGPEQAVRALNQNLDLNITDYVTFNWRAVATGVNILGGVDLELSNAEFKYINSYITETVKGTGIGSQHLESPGMNHLDGVQAVAYARLRYMDNDYTRTERQRKIIQLCVEKAKKADAQTLSDLAGNMLSMVATSLTWEDGMNLALNVKKYSIADTLGFPMYRREVNMGPKGACVLPNTLEKNVKELHTFLFGDEDYSVSNQVQEIDYRIYTDEQNYKARAAASRAEEAEKAAEEEEKRKAREEESSETDADGNKVLRETDEDGKKVYYETDADGEKVYYETDADGEKIYYETDEDGNRVYYETDEDGNRTVREVKSTLASPLQTDEDGRPIIEDEEENDDIMMTDPSGRPYYPGGGNSPADPRESAAASTENLRPGSPVSETTAASRPSAPGETTDSYVSEGPGHNGSSSTTAASITGTTSSGSGSSSPGGSSSGNLTPVSGTAAASTTAALSPASETTAAAAPTAAAPTTAAATTAAETTASSDGPGGSMMVEAVPN